MIKEKIIPPTTKRVEKQTKPEINAAIKQKTVDYIAMYRGASRELLSQRLDELNREWNTERVLEANAATITFTSSIIGMATRKPAWFILPGIVGFFLIQHAVQGWCPPIEAIRRLGVRTPEEINREKIAIKYLRGDFADSNLSPEEILEMASKD